MSEERWPTYQWVAGDGTPVAYFGDHEGTSHPTGEDMRQGPHVGFLRCGHACGYWFPFWCCRCYRTEVPTQAETVPPCRICTARGPDRA